MSWVTFLIAGVLAFNIGIVFGAVLSYIGHSNNSFDVWEVTNRDGATYYLTDPAEVQTALDLDGMLAVRRLRVLA